MLTEKRPKGKPDRMPPPGHYSSFTRASPGKTTPPRGATHESCEDLIGKKKGYVYTGFAPSPGRPGRSTSDRGRGGLSQCRAVQHLALDRRRAEDEHVMTATPVFRFHIASFAVSNTPIGLSWLLALDLLTRQLTSLGRNSPSRSRSRFIAIGSAERHFEQFLDVIGIRLCDAAFRESPQGNNFPKTSTVM